MVESTVIKSGLDGVVVAETGISEVEGQRGRLIIKGFDAEDLGFSHTFEETCALLWSSKEDGAELTRLFGQARVEAYEMSKDILPALLREHPMDSLRTATSLLTSGTQVDSKEYARITAAIGVFAANFSRMSRKLKPIAPDPKLTHAADFLRMITDETPSKAEIAGMDTYLTTVSDHGMNASTFTARVVASTESDNVSCIVAAIGALKGPLHGGAPGPVLDMLNEIGSPENAEKWIATQLDNRKRIMGMGHRIYTVRDPRAAIFEKAIRKLEEAGLKASRLPLARAVESTAERLLAERHPEKPLKANVEFYTAVLLDSLKLPSNIFSSTFAVGRAAGWFAHIAEQRALGRLIRPASKYTGAYPR